MGTSNRDKRTGYTNLFLKKKSCYQEHQNSLFMQQLLPNKKKSINFGNQFQPV